MRITKTQKMLIPVRKVLTNPKVVDFAQSTVCAISVETTLKALGRPTFIYFDKHANKRSKKYAATKEFLYQSFCLGLYLTFINKVRKRVYKVLSKKFAAKNPENKRKLELFDKFQNKIDNAKNKTYKKGLETKLHHLLNKNPDYHFGKGVKELSSIVSTVFILALCAPILSQIVLHPVLDLLFPKNKKKAQKN